ncbi:CPBP family intramembrane glutamic endopeptidase [Flammeovirga agarivorans]|uniref:CPBP family intramembrane metalloprotease n=1 Tax=Flammeovirga agarivorans TaxID=2726742 RepID=A0A7X8SJS3_9BACT|nr:type II CAAX endopeptidase family protein [Flammeovirga agarivorans]NLR91528.1 CPBP family intramembrane metalloprotease [Flammeovirga agarivorans]
MNTISYPNIKQSFGIFGIYLLSLLISVPLYFIFEAFNVNQNVMILFSYLVSSSFTFLIIHYLRFKQNEVFKYQFRKTPFMVYALSLCAMFCFQLSIITPISSLIPLTNDYLDTVKSMIDDRYFLTLFSIVIIAPVMEEFIFRGIMLDGLLKNYTPWKAIFLSSFLFGLIHMNLIQAVHAGLGGVLFGWIYYKTKNLLLPILLHSINNFFAFKELTSIPDDFDIEQPFYDVMGGIENYLLMAAVALIILGLSIYQINTLLGEDVKKGDENEPINVIKSQ